MKRFTIIERRWARGGKGGDSRLCNRAGFKCCLGFLSQRAGAKRIKGFFFPDYMPDVKRVLPELATKNGKHLSREIGEINDDSGISDAERKKKLTPLFAKIGWKPVYK